MHLLSLRGMQECTNGVQEARYVQHKFDDAIEDLNVALKFRPDKEMIIWIHRLKGWALANSGRYEEAVECFFDKTIAAARQLGIAERETPTRRDAAGLDVSGDWHRCKSVA